jgi:hypothetical protein
LKVLGTTDEALVGRNIDKFSKVLDLYEEWLCNKKYSAGNSFNQYISTIFLICSIWLMLLGRAISFTPETMFAPSGKISLLALLGKKFPRT